RALYEESLTIKRELGDRWGIAMTLGNLGFVASEQGEYGVAQGLIKEGMTIFKELGDRQGVVGLLESMAVVMQALAKSQTAVCLWGAADTIRECMGARRPPNEQKRYDGQVAQARTALGDVAFAAAWEEGRTMSWEQAVAFSLEETTNA